MMDVKHNIRTNKMKYSFFYLVRSPPIYSRAICVQTPVSPEGWKCNCKDAGAAAGPQPRPGLRHPRPQAGRPRVRLLPGQPRARHLRLGPGELWLVDSWSRDSSAHLWLVQVVPFPVSLAEGATLTISGFLTIAEELPVGATVTLDIVKEGLIDLPIPCLDLGVVEFGSW